MFGIDNVIVLLYLAGVLGLGIWAGRGIKHIGHYSVASKNFSDFVIFATLSASFIGGGFTMGNSEKVFIWGIGNIVALWGFSLKEIIVAKFIAPKIDRFGDCISIGDIMATHYGKPGKLIAGVFGMLLCAGIVGAQVGATGYVFEVFLGIPKMWGILIGCGIVIVYATLGGMKAVIYTDIVQFFILVIGIPLTLFLGIHKVGGFEALKAAVPADHLQVFGNKGFWALLSLFLTFVLGETLVPPYVQRLLIGRDAGHTSRGTLWSGLFSIPFFAITGAIGLVALALKPDLNANLALPFVVKEVLPVGVKGFVVAGIVSVVMSSADSFLNGAAVAVSNDIIKPLKKVPLSERTELKLAQLITFLVGVLAIVFAIKIKSVLDILIYAYNFWAPIIVVPLACVLVGRGGKNKWAFWLAAFVGFASNMVWNYIGSPAGVDGLVVGVCANALVMFVCGGFAKNGSA